MVIITIEKQERKHGMKKHGLDEKEMEQTALLQEAKQKR